MPTLERIHWISKMADLGHAITCHCSHNQDNDTHKFTFRIFEKTTDCKPNLFIQHILGNISDMASRFVASDKGHRHTSGHSVCVIYLRSRTGGFVVKENVKNEAEEAAASDGQQAGSGHWCGVWEPVAPPLLLLPSHAMNAIHAKFHHPNFYSGLQGILEEYDNGTLEACRGRFASLRCSDARDNLDEIHSGISRALRSAVLELCPPLRGTLVEAHQRFLDESIDRLAFLTAVKALK
eukprot:TRINITY_DN20270_c0_g3_i1.p1 TRINITY_DN20270_c0_g3~~TRINITY_DN20270_c0_g3_i1.p1  ORF type:complete len:237 (-),score=13.64 TRINITY_DN20270_c0_g3_i1:135-845(-)